jgi:hypothetical protein
MRLVARGDLQATFAFHGFEEVRRLGLRRGTEAAVRAAAPDGEPLPDAPLIETPQIKPQQARISEPCRHGLVWMVTLAVFAAGTVSAHDMFCLDEMATRQRLCLASSQTCSCVGRRCRG